MTKGESSRYHLYILASSGKINIKFLEDLEDSLLAIAFFKANIIFDGKI